jgi:hypothetical protein
MQKRYALSLTAEYVEKFQSICKTGGLAPSTLSRAVDDFLKDIVQVMERAQAAGKFTIRDMFIVLGEQMEKLQEESNNDAKKANEVPKKKGRSKIL